MFNHLTKIKPVLIKLPNNASVTAEFSGTVKLSNLTLLDVLYVPNFSVSLISISKLTSSLDCLLLFHNSFCMIVQKSHWRMIGTARKSHGLYYLDFTKDLTLPLAFNKATSANSNKVPLGQISFSHNVNTNVALDWHYKLGHVSNKVLKQICSQYSDIPYQEINACDTCHFSKQKKLPYSFSFSRTTRFFELIHVDIWGPMNTTFLDGFKYFVTVVDDFTRFTWTHLIRLKSDTRSILQNFITFIENQFDLKLKRLRSDNGKEFLLTDFFNSKGILHETTCSKNP